MEADNQASKEAETLRLHKRSSPAQDATKEEAKQRKLIADLGRDVRGGKAMERKYIPGTLVECCSFSLDPTSATCA
jgi:hypothetical protein